MRRGGSSGLAARMAEFVLCALAPRPNEELTIIDNRQMTG